MCDYSRMITEYIRVSLGVGDLAAFTIASFAVGAIVAWIAKP